MDTVHPPDLGCHRYAGLNSRDADTGQCPAECLLGWTGGVVAASCGRNQEIPVAVPTLDQVPSGVAWFAGTLLIVVEGARFLLSPPRDFVLLVVLRAIRMVRDPTESPAAMSANAAI